MRFKNGVPIHYGDILLKQSAGGLMHNVISLGQLLGGNSADSSKFVHAAIYAGDDEVAESVGGGLRLHRLDGDYTWHVYHVGGYREIRYMAADLARQMADSAALYRRGLGEDPNIASLGGYSVPGAARSAFQSSDVPQAPQGYTAYKGRVDGFLDDLWDPQQPRARQFFCSNFAAMAYTIASEAISDNPCLLIDRHYEKVSPAELEGALRQDQRWTFRGMFSG